MASQSEVIFESTRDFPSISLSGAEVGNLELAINITANAKSLAPVDLGQLRNGIQYETGTGDRGGLNDGPGETAEEMSVPLAPNDAAVMASAEHSIYQELGTSKMVPQPYIRPAVALVAGTPPADVLNAIEREIARGVLVAGVQRERFI